MSSLGCNGFNGLLKLGFRIKAPTAGYCQNRNVVKLKKLVQSGAISLLLQLVIALFV